MSDDKTSLKEVVASYLLKNPDFLDENPAVLEVLEINHQSGTAVSLTGWGWACTSRPELKDSSASRIRRMDDSKGAGGMEMSPSFYARAVPLARMASTQPGHDAMVVTPAAWAG